jgi:hypothetical protein
MLLSQGVPRLCSKTHFTFVCEVRLRHSTMSPHKPPLGLFGHIAETISRSETSENCDRKVIVDSHTYIYMKVQTEMVNIKCTVVRKSRG